MKTTKLILVLIFAILGVVYTLLPHDYHVSWGIGFGLDHTYHIVLGVIFFVIAGLVYWKMK